MHTLELDGLLELCKSFWRVYYLSRFLIVVTFFSILLQPVDVKPKPAWLKPGFYVEYFVENMLPPGILFVSNSYLYNLSLKDERYPPYYCNGTYRFELVGMNATFARFNVSLDLNAWRSNQTKVMPGEKIIWVEFKLIQTSFLCDVDMETLTVYRDGRRIGFFPLWRSFASRSGKIPLFLDFFGRRIDANYTFLENVIPYETPIGTFKYVFVSSSFVEPPYNIPYLLMTPNFFIPNNVYDRDTLLLVCSRGYMDEILLDHCIGILYFDEVNIRKTNVVFPQLKEESLEVYGWQFFLGLLIVGLLLPLLYKLFRKIRMLELLTKNRF